MQNYGLFPFSYISGTFCDKFGFPIVWLFCQEFARCLTKQRKFAIINCIFLRILYVSERCFRMSMRHESTFRSFFSSCGLKILISLAVLFIVAAGFVFFSTVHFYGEWVPVAPTCTGAGGQIRICRLCGRAEKSLSEAALGHNYGEWYSEEEPTAVNFGFLRSTCTRCGTFLTRPVDPVSALPKLFLNGHGSFTATEPLMLTARFSGGEGETELSGGIYLHASGQGVRKDTYRVRFLDPNSDLLFSESLLDIRSESLLLTDASDLRTLPLVIGSELFSSAGGEAIFAPVLSQVYAGTDFLGLYYVKVPCESGLEVPGKNAVLYAEEATAASRFRADADDESFSVLYTMDGSEERVYESFREMVDFVTTHTGTALTDSIDRYLDVERTIRYFLTVQLLNLPVLSGEHTVWMTEDGVCWYPSLGDGSALLPSEDVESGLPVYSRRLGVYSSSDPEQECRLWQILLRHYPRTIQNQWRALRKDVFSDSNLQERVSAFMSSLDPEVLAADRALFPVEADSFDAESFVARLCGRAALLDALF